MDVRRLQCFQAVIEEKVLKRAAERLRIAPSALSRQIALLEHEIGQSLFTRGGKRLAPTAEGIYLYERCSPVLRDIALLRQDVAAFASVPAGNVKFGAAPSLRDLVVVPVLETLLKRYPAVTVQLEEGMTMLLRDRLADGSIDLALIPTVEPAADLHLTVLIRESLVMVGPPGAGLSMKKPVTVAQLLERPLIASPAMNSLRKILDAAAHRARRVPNIRVETNLAETLLALVAAQQGFGFLPASGVTSALHEKRVSAAPVQGLTIEWALARRKQLAASPVVRALEQTVAAHLAALSGTAGWPTSTAAA